MENNEKKIEKGKKFNSTPKRDMLSIIKDYSSDLEEIEVINLINEFIEAET